MTIAQPAAALGQFEHLSDIAAAGQPGSCRYDAGRQIYAINGSGSGPSADHDSFSFAWRRMHGSFLVTAQLAAEGPDDRPGCQLGWMARTSLDPGSPFVSASANEDGKDVLQFRRVQGGLVEEVESEVTAAGVLQLERKGTQFIVSAARYGEPFTAVAVQDVDLGDDVCVGLFACAPTSGAAVTVQVRNVRIVVPAAEGFDRSVDPFASHLEILDVANGDRHIVYSADFIFEAPNWTRDGKALIYNSGGRLYRFDLATRTAAVINTGDVVRNNNDHVISFDGTMLAISSHDESGHSQVYTVPITGGEPRRVTPRGPSYLHGWSPDGQFLVYAGYRSGVFDIYRIPVAGGEETPLTASAGLDDGPEYTPDGKYIYFNSTRAGRMQIWRMLADGSGQEQLTDDDCDSWFPHISPDGRWVAFLSYLPGEVEPHDHPPARRVYLRLMPIEGGTPQVIAYLYGGQGTINVPSWSPDGRRLAFVSNSVPYR